MNNFPNSVVTTRDQDLSILSANVGIARNSNDGGRLNESTENRSVATERNEVIAIHRSQEKAGPAHMFVMK